MKKILTILITSLCLVFLSKTILAENKKNTTIQPSETKEKSNSKSNAQTSEIKTENNTTKSSPSHIKDLVTINGEKMDYEDHFILKIKDKSSQEVTNQQMSVFAHANSQGIFSRDQFVALTNVIVYTTILETISEIDVNLKVSDFLKNVNSKSINQTIGSADYEITIHFTKEGIKTNLKDVKENKNYSDTLTWDEI